MGAVFRGQAVSGETKPHFFPGWLLGANLGHFPRVTFSSIPKCPVRALMVSRVTRARRVQTT